MKRYLLVLLLIVILAECVACSGDQSTKEGYSISEITAASEKADDSSDVDSQPEVEEDSPVPTEVEMMSSGDYREAFIDEILSHQSDWSNDYISEIFFFDLDHDSNLELILSFTDAGSVTGIYGYDEGFYPIQNNYVKSDGSVVKDDITSAGASIYLTGAYYDAETDRYSVAVTCFSQGTEVKNASGELTFDGESCETEFFAMRIITPSGNQYYNGSNGYLDGTDIDTVTQEEYDAIIENHNQMSATVNYNKIAYHDEWATANTEKKRTLLEDAYDSFEVIFS